MSFLPKTPLSRCIRTAAALAMLAAGQAQAQAALPVVPLSAGMYAIQAEVAATPAAREQGLMYRKSMAPNGGMLFVFEQKAGHCFWMRNTELPLSIAFLADDGTIVNIEDMAPRSENNHCPKAAIRYALEMNQGWFAQKGIRAGAKIGGLPQAR
ncbi:putative ACR [compost metagenome]